MRIKVMLIVLIALILGMFGQASLAYAAVHPLDYLEEYSGDLTPITFTAEIPNSKFRTVTAPAGGADVDIFAQDCCIRDDTVEIFVDGSLLATIVSGPGTFGTHPGETHTVSVTAGDHTVEYRNTVSSVGPSGWLVSETIKTFTGAFCLLCANLSISKAGPAISKAGPASVNAATAFSYTLTVTNNGPDPSLSLQTDTIDFEAFANLTALGPVTTVTNTVTFSVTGGGTAFVADVGAPVTAFVSLDTPATAVAGARFLTDETAGPSAALDYFMTFASPVLNLSLDLYDYRVDGGPSAGDTATLNVFSDASFTTLVGSSVFTIPVLNPVDGNVENLSVPSPSAPILSASVVFMAGDVGTGIDNVTFTTATAVAPIRVTDTLPAGVSSVNFTGTDSSWSCSVLSGVVTCDRATDLGVATAPVITINLTAPDEGTTLNNTASVSGAITVDPTPGNNTSDPATTTNVIAQADLSITKSDSPDPVIAGTTLVYTVTVENAGPSDAQNVVVTDTLTGGAVTFVETIGCTNDGGGVPTCNLGTIVATGSKVYTITVTVDGLTRDSITNDVSVDSGTTDPDGTNNAGAANTTVIAVTDLSITTKDDSPDPVRTLQDLTYTLNVNNDGPSTATGVTVTDPLPAFMRG